MATFNTVDELVQILDADPQLADALRSRVLTRELLDLPETVATLAERFDEFSAATIARFEQSDVRIGALEQHMEKHFAELNKRMDALDRRMAVLDTRIATLEQRIAIVSDTVALLQQRFEAFEKYADRRFDALEKRVQALEKQIEELTARVALLEKRLEAFEKNVNERFDKVDERFGKVDERFSEMNQRFDALEERVDELDQRTERRFQRVYDDISILRSAHARNVAREQSAAIAHDMGLRWTRDLNVNDIINLIDNADTSDIPPNQLRRFHRADLIAEATDAQGETCYIAAEVSYTADQRDTDRAILFANYLTRFTQRSAYPVVASLRLDDRIAGLVESGDIFWHEMLSRDLEVE